MMIWKRPPSAALENCGTLGDEVFPGVIRVEFPLIPYRLRGNRLASRNSHEPRPNKKPLSFQALILTLQTYWAEQGLRDFTAL